jgi:hypothetical protein
MKTAFTEKTDWRRIGKSKPRCIVVGANNGQGGGPAEACANSVKPLKTYPQEWQGDEYGILDEGLDPAPGVETMTMAKTDNRTEAALGQKDTAGFTQERDRKGKEMNTTTITKTQPGQGRYATIGRSAAAPAVKTREERVAEKQSRSESRKRGRDLHGGLELLELDFLLDMVENIDSAEEHDVAMRKFSFHELARTNRLGEIDSNALRYYCVDEDGLYDKQTQFEAMKELAARTHRSMGH